MTNVESPVFVDLDDTLIRTVGDKRIPIPQEIEKVRELFAAGAELFAWSSGGADYARDVATELGIDSGFIGFLPKPRLMIDDQAPEDWRYLDVLHPNEVS